MWKFLSNGRHSEGFVWRQPLQGYASFTQCHAQICSRSDTEDSVLQLGAHTPKACNLFDTTANLNAPSYSGVLSVKALPLFLAAAR